MYKSDTILIVTRKSEVLSLNRSTGRIAFRVGDGRRPEDLCQFLVAHGVSAEVDPGEPAEPAVRLLGIMYLGRAEALVREWAATT